MCAIYDFINWVGGFLSHLILRAIVAWRAWDAGLLMFDSDDKTMPAQNIIPFNLLSENFSWNLVMWWQLIGALFILLGFRTRIVVLGLIVFGVATLYGIYPADVNSLGELWQSDAPADIAYKWGVVTLLIMVALFFLGSGWLSIDVITAWFVCSEYAKRIKRDRETLNRKTQANKFSNHGSAGKHKSGRIGHPGHGGPRKPLVWSSQMGRIEAEKEAEKRERKIAPKKTDEP